MPAFRHLCTLTVLCLFLAFNALFQPVLAQEKTKPDDARQERGRTMSPGGQQLVSIDFNNVDIGVFIKFISDLTNKNFIIDDRVKGKVSIISPGKITVSEAYKVFESVLDVNGFAAVPAGEVIKIVAMPEARTKSIKTRIAEEAGAHSDAVITQLIPLRYADPNEIKRLFTPLVSKSSVILAYQPTNTLIITDVQSNINRLLHILNAIDITGVGQQIAIIPVEYADATKLVNLLNSIFKTNRRGKGAQTTAEGVTFVADERTNVIVMLASEAEAESIRELVKSLDKETPRGQAKIHVYYLENASAEDLAKVLQDIPEKSAAGKAEGGKPTAPVVSGKVRITADKATNSLIIMADQEDYFTLESIIRKIDIPRAMVYIESLIMEVDVNKDFSLGTEWLVGSETSYKDKGMIYGGGFSPNEDLPYGTSAGIASGTGSLPAGFSVGIFGEAISIGGISFPSISALITAFKKDRDAQILSTPQILTTDNQEAKIYVGKNVPFQTQAGVASTVSTTAYNTYEYRDVGKTLKITPQISKDRMVRLDISLESTALESTTDFRPTTLKRTVETTAIVKDGHTIVLGGLIDESSATTDKKVPCLGDIQGLGMLFRSVAKGSTKTNLYIFLTPRVIQNPDEADTISTDKRTDIESVSEKKIKLYDKKPHAKDSDQRYKKIQVPAQPPEGKVESESPAPTPLAPQPAMSKDNRNPEGDTTSTGLTKSDETPAGDPAPPAKEAPAPRMKNEKDSGQKEPVDNAEQETIPENAPARKSAKPSGKGFTIQVASMRNAQAADRLIKQLTAQGYAAYSVRSEAGGAVWYRVRIGYYARFDAAQEVLQGLRAKQYNPILVNL
ncbi:MAG: type II secretion system secretin GspD [Desulfosarcinaceae bacterium]